MCGIAGAIGRYSERDLYTLGVLNAHRGEDAWGLAWRAGPRKLAVYKHAGSILAAPAGWEYKPEGQPVIVHTRAATNGSAKVNANNHPHYRVGHAVALVHNGMIFGHMTTAELYRVKLLGECDSELYLALLLEQQGSMLERIAAIADLVDDDGAVLVLTPEGLGGFRRSYPLYIKLALDSCMLSSIPAGRGWRLMPDNHAFWLTCQRRHITATQHKLVPAERIDYANTSYGENSRWRPMASSPIQHLSGANGDALASNIAKP